MNDDRRKWAAKNEWFRREGEPRRKVTIEQTQDMHDMWIKAAQRLGYSRLSQFIRHMTCERISELGMGDLLSTVANELPCTVKESSLYDMFNE